MEEKIKHVILIDDNKTTNFLNKYLMLKSKRFVKIETFENPEEVLYKLESNTGFAPNFIFLDLDMPTMDGWEFIDRFEKLQQQKEIPTKIFILTSIYHEWKAEITPSYLLEFLVKPLSNDLIDSLYHKYFDNTYYLE